MAYILSDEQRTYFSLKGYLILRDVLSAEETRQLQKWSQEVYDLPRDAESPWMPYEEINAHRQRVLCRTENFADYHQGFDTLLRRSKIVDVLNDLAGEDMFLFKEKINYKLAGSGGWAPHIDSTGYSHVKDIKHLTILLAVDATNWTNGGLEVVDGSHEMDIPIGEDCNITSEWIAKHEWKPVELEPGQLLIFGSYLAHRSLANKSDKDRKAVYATYNRASEGDMHKQYYEDRRQKWPATHLQVKGKDYAEGSLRYAFGSPMLSLSMGRQYEF